MKYVILIKFICALFAAAITINTGIITFGPKRWVHWVIDNSYLAATINFVSLLLISIGILAAWFYSDQKKEKKITPPTQ